MKRHTVVVFVFVVLAGLADHRVAAAQDAKPTLAIADVAVSTSGTTLPPPQLGASIAAQLLDELVSSDRFHIYDGQWLVPEAESGGRVNLDHLRASAASTHVDYVVLGTLTTFSTEQSRKRVGGILPTPFLAGGFSRERVLTAVGLTFRVVDVRTGEIVTSASAHGRGSRRSTGLGLLGLVRGLPLAGGGSSRLSGSRDAMLDDAVREAVHGAAQALASSAFRLMKP